MVPYYHIVSDEGLLHIKHLYKHKNKMQFKGDLDFLLSNFCPIDLKDLLDCIKRGNPFPQHSILLTFDDGFREMHDVVAPILLKKGISATFFLNSDFIDNRNLCYQHKASILVESLQGVSFSSIRKIRELLKLNELECNDIRIKLLSMAYQEREVMDEIAQIIGMDFNDYLSKNKPYLTTEQIRKLLRDGFYVGAHSIDHPDYSSLSLGDQLRQTEESLRYIRKQFYLDYGAFAFPHSDSYVSKEFYEEIYRRGLLDISFGGAGIVLDTFKNNIQRFSLEKPFLPARQIVAYQFTKKMRRIVAGRDIIIRD